MVEGNSAAGAAKSGFFGCLGVLAAIVAVVFAVVLWGAIGSSGDAKAVREGRAEAREYLAYCAAGVSQASGRFRGLAGADVWIGEDPSVSPGPLPANVGCPAKTAIGKATVRITVRCTDALDGACVEVTGAERADGRPLPAL